MTRREQMIECAEQPELLMGITNYRVSRISSMSKSAQAAVIEDYLQRGKTGGKEYA